MSILGGNWFLIKNFLKSYDMTHIQMTNRLTDTGDGPKLVHRRKRSKVDASIFFSFFPTRSSDENGSAPSRKYSRPLLDVFACIG